MYVGGNSIKLGKFLEQLRKKKAPSSEFKLYRLGVCLVSIWIDFLKIGYKLLFLFVFNCHGFLFRVK